MRFQPFPQRKIEAGEVTADALISIRCHEQDKPNIPLDNFGGNVLYLTFDDVAVTKHHWGNKDWHGPTAHDIDSALTFVDIMEAKGAEFVAIHCQQGKSRSAALALFLTFYMSGNAHESVDALLACDADQQMCFNPLLIKMADKMWNAGLDAALIEKCPPYVTWKKYWTERGF